VIGADDETVRVGDVDLAYRCWGPGDAGRPPIVLVHGGGGRADHWAPVASILATDRRCVALDQRGHGASTWSADGDYRHDTFVDDLDGFVAALGIEHATFVGFSMGCAHVVSLAVRQPALVARAVLIEWSPDAGLSEAAYATVRDRIAATGDAGFDQRLVDGTGRRETILERRPMLWDAVGVLRAPTLVIRGGRSPLFPVEQEDAMVRALPDGRGMVIPELGHALSRRVADQLAEAIDTFDRS
jgi:pimeloyl-ACP methyl ester carboxylesterase